MATQLVKGKEVQARKANEEESFHIENVLKIKDQIKNLREQLYQSLETLPEEVALVADVYDSESDQVITKTLCVGKPDGHYVVYKELDFIMNAKTTKKLLKEME